MGADHSKNPILEEFLSGSPPRSQSFDLAAVALEHGGWSNAWLTGTGSPIVHPDRAGPSVAIRTNSDVVLVDCGAGVSLRLAALGIEVGDVSWILLTHLHVDHTAELATLMLSPWATERRGQPLRIVGPSGTQEMVDRILAAYYYDLAVREPFGFDERDAIPLVAEIDGDVKFGTSSWSATSILVDHRPVEPAFGYRFELGDQRLVISGDTRPCDGIRTYAEGCDVLVHEALWPGWGFPAYHTTPAEAGAIAAEAGVGRLVLTHLIPGHLPDEVWLAEVRRHFAGPCSVGRDLMPLVSSPLDRAAP